MFSISTHAMSRDTHSELGSPVDRHVKKLMSIYFLQNKNPKWSNAGNEGKRRHKLAVNKHK